ncbi:hypothetical protein [Aquimarina celericrescens]|uniref:Uncharacterized protein n=1 Tax=Aquimarina celericrescens TaxID=1964542 RepID=A0ABW5AYA7_9FLAO|nr:hypothetical protein [Aquimarina celericrescens]
MKKYVFAILLGYNSLLVFSQKKDTIFLMLDQNDKLVLIENKNVFLFKNQKGINVKKTRDSIWKGLKKRTNEVDQNGMLVIKTQPVMNPWLEFRLKSKYRTINSEELRRYETKNRDEFLTTRHSEYSNKYAILKQKNKDCYDIYKIHIDAVE